MSEMGCDSAQVELISFEKALNTMLEHALPVAEIDQVALPDGLHRILAQDLVSPVNVPPASNSAMDGYAIRMQDVNPGGKTTLKVTQRIPAGSYGNAIQAGTAARIFTGAPIPPNCDAVIIQEQVTVDAESISFEASVESGQHIRETGEDIRAGETILSRGTRLRAQELGLAASIGVALLPVYRKVKVGIFFTGDELVEPGKALAQGQIYNSNRYTLGGLLKTLGCEIVDLGIVGDTLQQTEQAILKAAEYTDIVITSGGASVGEEDHVCTALENLGQLYMWKLDIKPGKPVIFGMVHNTAFIGLPGNPVSVFAGFSQLASPFIKKSQGRSKLLPKTVSVKASFERLKIDRRREFARGRLLATDDGQYRAEIYNNQSSGVLMSTTWADGFVVIPGNTQIHQGDKVDYISFSEVLE
jgi:molybdopterin molybdotransferase